VLGNWHFTENQHIPYSSATLSLMSAYVALKVQICNRSIMASGHILTIGFPETAHRSFSGAAFRRFGAVAAHFHHGLEPVGAGDATLHEPAHGAVLHRNEARGADQVGLLEADFALLFGVVGVAEIGPVQL